MARKAKEGKHSRPSANAMEQRRLNASWIHHPIRLLLGVALCVLVYRAIRPKNKIPARLRRRLLTAEIPRGARSEGVHDRCLVRRRDFWRTNLEVRD